MVYTHNTTLEHLQKMQVFWDRGLPTGRMFQVFFFGEHLEMNNSTSLTLRPVVLTWKGPWMNGEWTIYQNGWVARDWRHHVFSATKWLPDSRKYRFCEKSFRWSKIFPLSNSLRLDIFRKETWTCRATTLYEFLLHFLLVPAGVDTTMRKYRMLLVDSPKLSQPHLSVSIYLYMQCVLAAAPATGRMKTAPCKARLYVRARHVPKWSRGTNGWKTDLGVKG